MNIKPLAPLILFLLFISNAFGQVKDTQLKNVIQNLDAGGKSKSDLENVVNGVITSPTLYNSFWKTMISQVYKKDSAAGMFLKDMNLRFKTFEMTGNSAAALGFSYDFNFNYVKFKEASESRISNSLGLSANGNVAFRNEVNPLNFMETKVLYSFSKYMGGVVTNSNDSVFAELNRIEDKLVEEKDIHSPASTALWEAFGKNLRLSNQYYYAISPKIAYESNQDFSRSQFSPGVAVDLGVKAWNKNATLARFNLFDYPFALLRLITGTDKKFTPYGSTLPVLNFAFDYVIPSNDTIRSALLGNTNPFPRISCEMGFRTFVKKVGTENVYFNANYKYFRELSAPSQIVAAGLNYQSFFVLELQSGSGFIVSYANGRLPFDVKDKQTYSIGFNYKFN